MNELFSFSYPRYLEAKKTVDERSLNGRVWRAFLDRLKSDSGPTAILDVGGGTGATLLRLLNAAADRPLNQITYTLIDPEVDNLSAAVDHVSAWADTHGWVHRSEDSQHQLYEKGGTGQVTIRFHEEGLFSHAKTAEGATYDAIVAQAVLDLFDVSAAIQALNPCLRSGGTWYLPIHFDGLTAFEPVIDESLDRAILERYHESIPSPRSGRALLTALPNAGAQLHAVGASDWIVHGREGAYPDDEEYFLQCILQFIQNEVGESDYSDFRLSVQDWIQRRADQLRKGELIYLAHQLDVCGIKR
jgi:SAM-dependent methyltransferase